MLFSAVPGFAQSLLSTLGVPNPTFMAIDRNRTIGGTTADWLYVSNHGQNDETGGGLIYRFNLTSGSTTPVTIGTRGTGPGQFTSPDGILIDAATGDLIVADRALDRVQRITNTGTPVWMFGSNTGGAAADEMHGPCALATDSSGAIYIAEHGEMLSSPPGSGGSYVSKYTLSGSGSSTTATQQWRIGGIGTGNGQFNNTGPYGVAVSGSTLFVTDAYNARVQTFDLSGNYQSQFAIPNTMPLGIYLDSAGALWVAETSNQGSGSIQQVQKYTTAGAYANTTLTGNLSLPFDTAIDGTKAYVSSWATNTVDVFDLSTSSGGGVPVINSSTSASGTVGQSFSYTITATNSPTSYAVSASTPLPAGLSLSGNVISGTPTTAATTTVNLTATNSSGTSAPFALAITIAAAPAPGTGPVVTQFTYVAHTYTFHLTFSEPVTGVDLSDFVWDQTGSSTGTLDSVVQNDPSNYTLTFTFISGAPGTLAITLKSSGTNIVGVNSGLPYTGAGVYRALVPVTPHLETDAPVVNGFTAQDAGNNTVNFVVSFNKQSWNVQPSNVTINASSGVTAQLGYIIPTDDTGYHFTIPVSYTGSAGGTISVTLANNPSLPTISDGNYNYYVGPNTSDVFTIPAGGGGDTTPPTVSSFTVGANTGATVTFNLNFSEPVTGVDATDFTVGGTGATGATIGAVTGSGSSYSVPVTYTATSGTVNLTLKSTGTGIADLAGNALSTSSGLTSGTYTITSTGGGDTTPPTVSGFTVGTNAGTTVNFNLTFSEAVTGVDATDFTIGGTGAAGAAVGPVTGTGSSYTVPVTYTATSGTVNLTLKSSGTGIADLAGNALSTTSGLTSGTFTIPSSGGGSTPPPPSTPIGPSITSFALDVNSVNTTHTQATVVVTFDTPVTGVDATDFAIVSQGASAGAIASVTGSGTTWNVAFNYIDQSGAIQLAIKTAGTGIVDGSGHAFVGGGITATPVYATGTSSTADTSVPTVASFTAGTPSGNTVNYTLTFSQPVTGVASSDFFVSTGGGVTAQIGTITGSGATYTIPVTLSGAGSVQLTAIGGATNNIINAAHNWFGGGSGAISAVANVGSTGSTDTTPPTVSGFTVGTNSGTTVNFNLTFSEAVTGVDATDFTLGGTAATGATVGAVTGSGSTYTVPVTYTATSGTVFLTLKGSGTGIADLAGNALAAGTGVSSGTYTIVSSGGTDTTPPTVASFTVGTSTSTAVNFNLMFSEAVTGVDKTDFTVGGTAAASTSVGAVTGSGSTYTVPVTYTATSGTITLNLKGSGTGIADLAGNALAAGSGVASGTFTISSSGGTTSAPVVTSQSVSGTVGLPMSFAVNATNNPTSWSLSGQPSGISIGLSTGLISGTPSASGTFNATVTATNSAGSGTGTVTFNIAASTPPPPPVLKGQTVIFSTPTSAILINQPISLGATATSGGPITYTIISGNAVLNGSTLTIKGSGPVVIRATQAGDSTTWASASADATFTASKVPQTISVPSLVQQVKANESVTLAASASSNLPITYTLVSGPATLSGNTLTFTGATGTVVVTASQGGDDTFSAASDLTLTFNVGAVGQQLFMTKIGADDVAVAIAPDNTKGILFMRVSAVGQAIVARFSIAADGSFSTTVNPIVQTSDSQATPMASVSYTVSGTISNGVLNGSVSTLGSFSATAQAETGTAASYAGFYTAHIPGSASGDVYLLVDASGQAYALVVTPTSVASGTGTVSSSGAVSVTTSDGGTVNASVNTANSALTGSVKTGTSTAAIAGLSADATPTDRLINISSRLRVSGDDVAHSSIAGFVVTGDTPKQILIRAVGPSLSILGINDGLSDPTLQVYDSNGKVIASNSGWNNDATISAANSAVGAFNLITGSHDAALLLTLAPGAYTAQVHSQNNGLVLVEAYDVAANAAVPTKQLVNLSTRGYVGTGEDVLIGGFVVSGNEPKRVLIRAAGPALGILHVNGTLADPVLTVYDAKNNVIAKNDNWGTPTPVDSTQVAASASDIMAAENATGAFAFPTGSADAAVIITLNPGNYTAIVSGANNTTGAAMVEVYEIPNP